MESNTQHIDILAEAKFLYDLGFGVHWLQANSKRPAKAGWTNSERDNWKTLEAEYRHGYGLGVRLGAPSKIAQGYLAVIDIDLKSGLPEDKRAALRVVENEFPGLLAKAPFVKTGRGYHIYLCTETPLPSKKIQTSTQLVKVRMPTEPINPVQMKAVRDGTLTKSDLRSGLRARPSWQVEFMSKGRQVVLPPTIHPDTGKHYLWKRKLFK